MKASLSHVRKKLRVAGQAHVHYVKKEGGLSRCPCDEMALVAALNITLDRDAHKPRRAGNWGPQVGEDGHVTELFGELTGASGGFERFHCTANIIVITRRYQSESVQGPCPSLSENFLRRGCAILQEAHLLYEVSFLRRHCLSQSAAKKARHICWLGVLAGVH